VRDIQTIEGVLTVVNILPSSYNGNPRYLIAINSVCCKTAVDSSLGYCVTNYDGKPVIATIGTHYRVKTLDSIKPLTT
jgi:hypothetical protein